MKKCIIIGARDIEVLAIPHNLTKDARAEGSDSMVVSDGYHTFDELYDHRITLYIALCRHMHDLYALENPGKYKIWKSKKHSDESEWEGWFILGIGQNKGEQITYHLPLDRWDEVSFVEEIEKAPEWDGHTPADVLERLKNI